MRSVYFFFFQQKRLAHGVYTVVEYMAQPLSPLSGKHKNKHPFLAQEGHRWLFLYSLSRVSGRHRFGGREKKCVFVLFVCWALFICLCDLALFITVVPPSAYFTASFIHISQTCPLPLKMLFLVPVKLTACILVRSERDVRSFTIN